MKRTYLKTILLVLSLPPFLVLCWFGNAFFGNPVSYLLASRTAQTHLVKTYPGTDYYIDRIAYSFKDSDYHAFVKSPSSIDTHFSLAISKLGKLEQDTYSSVLNGFNTARRLSEEYRALTDPVFQDPTFPYNCFISYAELEIHPDEAFRDRFIWNIPIPSYAINQKELVVDKLYDSSELGKRAGHLYIHIDSDVVTVERAAEIMLDIKAQFDRANVPFKAMDFTLQYPFPDQGSRPEGWVTVSQFLYDDIYADGMTIRVDRAHKKATAYYEKMDALGK